ncbi:MAG TPA: class I SAM-dependent methyltransferase [Pseudomonas sp.]|uniref:class I SAM-dependent methyltransferase n=1 Tax=Pseudomonas sp. TaxID=306 RepID=UPI002EDA988A
MADQNVHRLHPAHYQTLESIRIKNLLSRWSDASSHPLSVLDYGFGTGKYLPLFASLNMHITGIDINPQYIKNARDQGIDAYHEDDMGRLDKKFDVIFLSHLIEHLPPEKLMPLLDRLILLLADQGRLIIVCPVLGERFFYDFSHIRPYYPQSIRHAFGQSTSPLSFGASEQLVLNDIYFFKDPYRTRKWRSFYVQASPWHGFTEQVNKAFDLAWRLSDGRIGVISSWLGVYTKP